MLTETMLEYSTVVVREEEYDKYKEYGHKNLLVIPKGEVHDFMSTFYWIIENSPEDVICILDDDITQFVYRQDEIKKIGKDDEGREIITSELERIGQLLVDLKLGLAFSGINMAHYVYDKEFGFKGMVGPIRWINKLDFKAKYDPNDPAAGDIDMCYQELLLNRVVLQEKYVCAHAVQNKIIGENENISRQDHIAYVSAMKNKWGKYYLYDFKKNEARINVKR